jgi:Leucine-rich repeat (LRR) protein
MHGSKFQENRINNDVSEGLFFNANSAIFQLYHEENKLIFNEMMIAPLKTHYPDSEPTSLCSFSFLLSVEATNTNFVVFGLTRLGLEPTIYRTRGEHTNHYTTDAVACI